jgi:hypothetical protein
MLEEKKLYIFLSIDESKHKNMNEIELITKFDKASFKEIGIQKSSVSFTRNSTYKSKIIELIDETKGRIKEIMEKEDIYDETEDPIDQSDPIKVSEEIDEDDEGIEEDDKGIEEDDEGIEEDEEVIEEDEETNGQKSDEDN